MRLRLLIRRLTVSAPRMAVRSALPWPFRWVVLALVFGFCAAIGLWAFEFGKHIAGLDSGAKEELQQMSAQLGMLRADVLTLKEERDKAQSIANTVDTLLTSEKVAQERLAAQNKQLEADNQSLRDDLGFFEKLIPTAGVQGIAIRGLQAEVRNGREIKWQVLVIQALKNPPEFSGRLELSFTGLLNGKPWVATLPGGAQAFKLKQYGRLDGVFEMPPQAVIKGVTAKILDGTVTKAVQSIKL
ncbi:MAG: hypothetical protein HHJ15_15190 [Rhodoferax sp.]|uniref:DUF6776 family protein n=1 Tax=Rhodoferax sp. TaxID=50421 RepID=UPI0017CC1AD8|nr:DUF6776 family protein [Rhodoferax sp.]NMM21276.1 hypothetical protein [Rhodoferax sp.]